MEREHSEGNVPHVVRDLIEYLVNYGLDDLGLFRIPGTSTVVKKLRNEYNQSYLTGTIFFDDLSNSLSLTFPALLVHSGCILRYTRQLFYHIHLWLMSLFLEGIDQCLHFWHAYRLMMVKQYIMGPFFLLQA